MGAVIVPTRPSRPPSPPKRGGEILATSLPRILKNQQKQNFLQLQSGNPHLQGVRRDECCKTP